MVRTLVHTATIVAVHVRGDDAGGTLLRGGGTVCQDPEREPSRIDRRARGLDVGGAAVKTARAPSTGAPSPDRQPRAIGQFRPRDDGNDAYQPQHARCAGVRHKFSSGPGLPYDQP
jgi:hypothetical protein